MRRVFLGLLASVFVMGGSAFDAQAEVQNRITGAMGKTAVTLPQSVSPRTARATDLGEADGSRALTPITLHFNMTAAQAVALTELLADQQNPGSAQYRRWLTPEQFADRFGLSAADIASISQWAAGQGFRNVSVARSRTFIQFSGTVGQAQAAFQTSIHKVLLDGEEHIANVTGASLPSGLAAVVGGVSGLNDFRLKPRLQMRKVQPRAGANPAFTSSVSGDTYIAPGDFYTIYDVSPLLSSSINGTGVTIAVAGQTDIQLSDIAAFRSASGLSANPPTVKLYGADPGTPKTNGVANDEVEADLDLEWSGAVAPAAAIIYANSTDAFNSLMMIVDNKLAPIASISYGNCESNIGQPNLNTFNSLFMQANAQGMTIVGPSGDSGATDCDYQAKIATQGLSVDFPASSPYVTGVGGTEFNEGSGTYFGTANDANGGSVLSYIPEDVWNSMTSGGELSAGGGGLSAYFAKPSWQTGTGVPDDSSRDVPDLALNADPDHDGYLICSQGSCAVGFRASANGTLSVVGGTSVSTPSFAGILALVEQKIGASIGNANPTIYGLARSSNYNNVFHDVTAGNNSSLCQAGSKNCPNGGDIGYTAGVGYDLASGWGSVNAFNLANCWTSGASGAACEAATTTTSDFTLTPATTTVTVKAGADAPGIVFTLTPVNGFSGPVSFTASTTSSTLAATFSFTVTPLTITAPTAGTTILDLSSYVAQIRNGTALARSPGGLAAVRRPEPPGTERSTLGYSASGAALSLVIVLMVPRRRRMKVLLAFAVLVGGLSGILGLQGCGSGSRTVAPTQVNSTPGTYTINVAATGTSAGATLTHNATVTLVVQ